MLKFIEKYGAFIFLINGVMIKYLLNLSFLHAYISYFLCGFGLLLIMFRRQIIFSNFSLKSFRVIYLLILITVLYITTLGIETFNQKNITYLFAKLGSFVLIIIGITRCKFYFNGKYLNYFIYILSGLLIIGALIRNVDIQTSRLALGFDNSNQMGILAALGFGIVLLKEKTISKKMFFFIFLFFIAVLLSGSRISLVMILASILYKYKFKIQYYVLGVLFLFGLSFFFNVDKQSSSIQRLIDSVDFSKGEIKTGREVEFDFALVRIKSKLYTGNGFMSYKEINPLDYNYQSERAPMGSHNSYLTIMVMYGVVFGTVFLIPIFNLFFKAVKKYYHYHPKYSVHLYIVLSVLIASMSEDLIIGINSGSTYLFFISISILGIGFNSHLKEKSQIKP